MTDVASVIDACEQIALELSNMLHGQDRSAGQRFVATRFAALREELVKDVVSQCEQREVEDGQ